MIDFSPNISSKDLLRDRYHADWKHEKIMEEIKDFESALDDEHEIALLLSSFGTSTLMLVTDIGYQNPDMLYFYGLVDGKEAQLIQHTSQLNFLITSTSVSKQDPTKEPRRIGFIQADSEDE